MLFAVAGPSGAGKTYLFTALLAAYPDQFMTPQIVTTRSPRPGSQDVDRTFVSKDEFDAMHQAGHFMLADEFQSNWYGFPKSITEPSEQHSIVNIWPKSIPYFAKLTGVKIIGLAVEPTNFDMLRRRMLGRGDTPEIVSYRMKQIEIDLADLAKFADVVETHGQMFTVTGDDTIPEQVVPWILQQVSLV